MFTALIAGAVIGAAIAGPIGVAIGAAKASSIQVIETSILSLARSHAKIAQALPAKPAATAVPASAPSTI